MHLVQNDVRVRLERFGANQLLEQDARRAEQNGRVLGHKAPVQPNLTRQDRTNNYLAARMSAENASHWCCAVQTYLIADNGAQLPVPFVGHAMRDASGGDSTRLRHNDVTVLPLGVRIVQDHLRHLQWPIRRT